MINSDNGNININGDLFDVLADLGVAIYGTADASYKATGEVEPILRSIVGITCDALLQFLDKIDASENQKSKSTMDRLFDEAIKDWEKNQSE